MRNKGLKLTHIIHTIVLLVFLFIVFAQTFIVYLTTVHSVIQINLILVQLCIYRASSHDSVRRAGFSPPRLLSPFILVSHHSTLMEKIAEELEDVLPVGCCLDSSWRWHLDAQAQQLAECEKHWTSQFRTEIEIEFIFEKMFWLHQQSTGSDSQWLLAKAAGLWNTGQFSCSRVTVKVDKKRESSLSLPSQCPEFQRNREDFPASLDKLRQLIEAKVHSLQSAVTEEHQVNVRKFMMNWSVCKPFFERNTVGKIQSLQWILIEYSVK